MQNNIQKEQSGYAAYVLLGLAAILLSFYSLGYRGLWAAEGRWAEVTREMILSGDFFHPNINGLPYFDKPLLTYWLIAATSFITGQLNEWTVRIPSALSLLVSVAATVWLGRKLWSREIGLIAGWLLLSTYGVLFWSRTGTADLENVAAIILAIAWYWAWRDRPRFWTFLVFYLIAFIGAHMKGLTAVVVPIAAILPDILTEKRWRKYLHPAHFLAIGLAGLIYLWPFLYASMTRPDYHSSGLALVFQENIKRYFDPFDHVNPFYIYFYELPLLLIPWSPLFFATLFETFPRWKQLDAHTRWLIQAVLIIFLFFTASGSRRGYYLLPLVPLCALWIALFVGNAGGYSELSRSAVARFLRGFQVVFIALLALIELISPFIWPLVVAKTGFEAPFGLKLALAATGIVTFFILAADWKKPEVLSRLIGAPKNIGGLLVAATIILAGYFCWQTVPLEKYRTERPFAQELKKNLGNLPPEQLVFYQHAEPNVLFYLDLPRPATILKNSADLQNFFAKDQDEYFLVIRRKTFKSLESEFPHFAQETPSFGEAIFTWQKPSKKLIAFHFESSK